MKKSLLPQSALPLFIFLNLSFSNLLAQESVVTQPPSPEISGESEASSIVISGLAKTESFGAKTTNTYKFSNSDLITIFGKYLKTSTQAAGSSEKIETARNWEAGLRFEKSFVTDLFNGFLQHKAESDPFNGIFLQRDSTDLGAKYYFNKTDDLTFFSELGYRYQTQLPEFVDSMGNSSKSTSSARIYVEAAYKFNESTSGKFWTEYVPNFKSNDFTYTTAEASLSVAMSKVLSLKTAYQIYRREIGDQKNTTTWTTALVARY